jgi:hypothetical protein
MFLVQMDKYLRVGMTCESVTGSFKVISEFGMVVDLAIEDDTYGTIFGDGRLSPSFDIYDRQSAVGDASTRIDVSGHRIGAAM